MQKICGRFAVNGDALSRSRMDKLKMRGMKSNALNQLLRRFRWMIFSVPDYWMARRRKLHADLILETCLRLNPYERSIRKKAFDGIPEFGASGFRVFHDAQLLIHSFTSKIVDERSLLSGETATHDREILPHRSVGEKLPHQRRSIRRSLGKKQSPRRKSIDAMYDQRFLLLQFETGRQQRPCRRSSGTRNWHRQEPWRFVDNDHRIVFVEHGKFAGETRPTPVLRSQNWISLCGAAASFFGIFLHLAVPDNSINLTTVCSREPFVARNHLLRRSMSVTPTPP